MFSHPVFLYIFAGNIDPYSIMSSRLLISILLLSILLPSCNPFKTATERMDRAEEAINTAPEQALASLDSIRRTTLITAPRRARYALLKAMALDKCYIDTTDLNVIMPAVSYYSRRGSPDEKMRTFFYLGNIERNAGKRESTMADYIIADESSPEATDYYTAGLLKSAIAGAYSRDFNSSKELEYMEAAIRFAEMAGDSVGVWYYEAQLADCYFNNEMYSLSDSLYERFLKQPILDTLFYSERLLVYAKSQLVRDTINCDKGLSLIQRAISLDMNAFSPDRYGTYAYALEVSGYQDEADSIMKESTSKFGRDVPEVWKYKVAEHRGDNEAALEHLQNAMHYQDSVVLKVLEQSMLRQETVYLSQKASTMSDLLEKEKSRKKVIMVFLFATIIAFVLYYWNRRYRDIQREMKIERIQDETQRQLETFSVLMNSKDAEIGTKDSIIRDLRLKYISGCRQRFELLNSLCSEYYRSSYGDKKERVFKTVESEVGQFKLSKENFLLLEEMLNDKMDNIMKKFHQAMPNRRPTDYAFIAYIVAGFDPKTIAVLLDIGVNTVYTKKNRIKKEISGLTSEYREELSIFFTS